MEKNPNNEVSAVLESMQEEILAHGLEVLQRYPRDLLVHDREILERVASPGVRLGWVVGHCHTHLIPLGVHARYNEMAPGLTRMSGEDRFYIVEFLAKGHRITAIDRSAFAGLANTPIPYSLDGASKAFWLLKNGSRVGYCELINQGHYPSPSYQVVLTPVAGISAADRAALDAWGSRAAVDAAGTLFVKAECVWKDPVSLLKAA